MSARRINGIKWAKQLAGRPGCIPEVKRATGARAQGLRYEKDLEKGLATRFERGAWWEFEDREGKGYCQTDFWAGAREWVIILEVKLSWCEEAEDQLFGLYCPVLSKALDVPWKRLLPVVVCRNLTRGLDRPIASSLQEALRAVRRADNWITGAPVWHHVGGVPLLKVEGCEQLRVA